MTTRIPTSIVIFGASGDLTRRKLVPALMEAAGVSPALRSMRVDPACVLRSE